MELLTNRCDQISWILLRPRYDISQIRFEEATT